MKSYNSINSFKVIIFTETYLFIHQNLLPMLSKTILDALNKQVLIEAESSQAYLAMASWADVQPGLKGVTQFFFKHSDEERVHMLKLIRYINERGGFAIVPPLSQPKLKFPSLKKAFEELFKHEVAVTKSIHDIVYIALKEKDYATHNFLQWYVNEQIEEEKLARECNDKLEMIGDDKSGLYLFDRDIIAMGNDG